MKANKSTSKTKLIVQNKWRILSRRWKVSWIIGFPLFIIIRLFGSNLWRWVLQWTNGPEWVNDLIKVLIWIPKLAFTIAIQHQTFAYISQKIITNVVRCIICFSSPKSSCPQERERQRSQMPQNLMHPIYLRVFEDMWADQFIWFEAKVLLCGWVGRKVSLYPIWVIIDTLSQNLFYF
jgi:hypothetical protein